MAVKNNLEKLGVKFPISIPIAIGMALTHHIFFVSNTDITHDKLITITDPTPFEKEHLLIFVTPKENPRILHFFNYEKWNNYFYSDRIIYDPLKSYNGIEFGGINYNYSNSLGKINYKIKCKFLTLNGTIVQKDFTEGEITEVACEFQNENNHLLMNHTYSYQYKFNKDKTVDIFNIRRNYSREEINSAKSIDSKTWIQFIFYGVIIQYFLFPWLIHLTRFLKRLIKKMKGETLYEDLPTIKVKATLKK